MWVILSMSDSGRDYLRVTDSDEISSKLKGEYLLRKLLFIFEKKVIYFGS